MVEWPWFIRGSFPFRLLKRLKERGVYRAWVRAGKPQPPPSRVRRRALLDAMAEHGFQILIETGTGRGEMVEAVRAAFREIFTMEASERRFRDARNMFRRDAHVHCLHGDSVTMLRHVLARISEPCLFWLDSHGEGAERGKSGARVLAELRTISEHMVSGHGIVINHARLFVGANGYCDLAGLREAVRGAGFRGFDVRDDMVFILPDAEKTEEPG